MKWYAYNENEDGTYDMILDHNTTSNVQYNSTRSNAVQKEVAEALNNDTKTWKVEARLITAGEIANITKNTTWSANGGYYYFDSNNQTLVANSKGASKYYWLYDYTANCENFGCNVQDGNSYTVYGNTSKSTIQGYWTNTAHSSSSTKVWKVSYVGCTEGGIVNYSYFGLRPVITIPK